MVQVVEEYLVLTEDDPVQPVLSQVLGHPVQFLLCTEAAVADWRGAYVHLW